MTAEIAVVNRGAVALAADSLVTVSSDTGPEKTYNANKLFTLSKHHPVGIMVYGNAEFMHVPWETVIKEYRKNLGEKSFPTIQEYADNLFSWIAKSSVLAPEDRQNEWAAFIVQGFYIHHIRAKVDEEVKDRTEEGGEITLSQLEELIERTAIRQCEELESLDDRGQHIEGLLQVLKGQHRELVGDWIPKVFGSLPVSQRTKEKLLRISTLLFSKSIRLPGHSGVVIAGFGDQEAFPVVRAFEAFGCTQGFAVYDIDADSSCSPGDSGVMPFAQGDVARTFIQGADPSDLSAIERYLSQVFAKLPKIIAEHLSDDHAERSDVTTKLKEATVTALEAFSERVRGHLRKKHTEPLLAIINSLPKEELAELAESLLSLTSMKRKMSQGIETVGGPIDVAVISKGDGFIWIKRKHYFRPELNTPFLKNYFER